MEEGWSWRPNFPGTHVVLLILCCVATPKLHLQRPNAVHKSHTHELGKMSHYLGPESTRAKMDHTGEYRTNAR